jgi:bacterioferritin-associated ferredoxin
MGPAHTSKIVCDCLKVTEATLVREIHAKRLKTVQDLICYTQAGDGCTACHPLLKEYLAKHKSHTK